MLARSWFDALKSRLTRTLNRQQRRASGQRGPATRRLRLEALEDRCLLAFLPAVNYAVGASPQAVLTADFNNDAVMDLAVANSSSSTVSVLLGNADDLGIADGTFQPAVNYPTGNYPQSLAVGDFNGDGKLDLATANSGDVSVLLGNPVGLGDADGTFGAASSYGVVGNPQSVAVGDFNGDGTLDLGVTSNLYYPGHYGGGGYYGYYWYPGYNTAYANVLVGNGTGSFSGPNATYIDSYAYANSALAANLNGDIYDDFVTFDSYGYVTVLLGDSSGTLQGPTYFYTGDYSYGVAAGDLDGDLDNDLVAANFNGNSVGVLLGDGLGGFSGPVNYDAGGYPFSIVLGDFTHDGNLDVATSNYYSDQVSVLYGGGDGGFSTPALSATGSYPRAIAAGDFNGDTWLDAATANLGDNTVSVLINNQDWPDPPPPPPPSVSINDVTVTEGNTSTVDATFTLTLSFGYATPITVHYETAAGSAAAGSDYTATSGDVTFAAYQTSYPITVTVLGDRLAESTENFVVNLSTADAFIGDGQGIGTILDDEPLASINDVTVTEGNTGSVNATFTVTLSALSDVDVTVHYDTAAGTATAGSDYTSASGNVIIPHGQISRTLAVAVTGDRLAEPTENFVVNLSAPVNAGIADGQGAGTILDNEPRISINNVTKKEGNGGSIQFLFTVTLSAAYDQTVTVNYATANGTATAGSDYVAKSGSLSFAPGVRSMTITIMVLANKVKEADETFFVNLSSPSSNALIFDAQGIGTILNDDKR